MGERKDLKVGREQVADLEERWQQRRKELEQKLDESWARLKASQLEGDGPDAKGTPDAYQQIVRLDRSISYLDRALLHLDDIERGDGGAKDVPLRPASTPKQEEDPEHAGRGLERS